MSCCGKNSGCAKRETALPTEEFFSTTDAIAPIAGKLLEIAAAGLRANTILRTFRFSNAELDKLAKRIADLAIENEYLRKVTDLFSPATFDVTGGEITIAFGPKNEYALKIPITNKCDRQKIITQLRTAADKLEIHDTAIEEAQKILPFAEQL